MLNSKRQLSKKAFIELYHISIPFFIVCYVLTALQGLSKVLPIVLLQVFFDRVEFIFNDGKRYILILTLIAYIGSRVLSHVLDSILNYLYEYYDLVAAHGMNNKVNLKIGTLYSGDFEDKEFLAMVNKAYRGTKSIRNYVDTIMLIILEYVPEIAVIVFYLYRVNRLLPLIFVPIIGVVIFVQRLQEKEFSELENEVAEKQRRRDVYNKYLADVSMIMETKSNDYHPLFLHKIKNNALEQKKLEWLYEIKKCNIQIVEKISFCLGHIIIFVILCVCMKNGLVTMGVFAALLTTLDELFEMIDTLVGIISEGVSEKLEQVKNYFLLIDKKPRKEGNIELSEMNSIELKNVSYSYPMACHEDTKHRKKAIDSISLKINKGDHIAIVGANGSGKSTLVKLICGIYAPSQGILLYNDIEASKYSRKSVLEKITAVFQNYGRYALTIDENIRLGRNKNKFPYIDEKEDEIILKSKTLSKVDEIKLDYEDCILSREFDGVNLSGGQWQKVAIARGIYRDGDVILLDEPTSAIDPMEEKRIYDLFEYISEGKTSIIVTHRMGAVKIANKIVVMKDGNITGIGDHEKLLEDNEDYRQLWNSQAQIYNEDMPDLA